MKLNNKLISRRRSIATPSFIIREALCSMYTLKKSLKQTHQTYYIVLKKFFLKSKHYLNYYFIKNYIQLKKSFMFFVPTHCWSKNKFYIISDFNNKFLALNNFLNYFVFLRSKIKFAENNSLKIPSKPFGLTYFFSNYNVEFDSEFLDKKNSFFEIYKDYLDFKGSPVHNVSNYYSETTDVQIFDFKFNNHINLNKMYFIELYKILIYLVLNKIINIYF